MIDPTPTPPKTDSGQQDSSELTDELFDQEFLSDEDSEFLAELDKVLADGAEGTDSLLTEQAELGTATEPKDSIFDQDLGPVPDADPEQIAATDLWSEAESQNTEVPKEMPSSDDKSDATVLLQPVPDPSEIFPEQLPEPLGKAQDTDVKTFLPPSETQSGSDEIFRNEPSKLHEETAVPSARPTPAAPEPVSPLESMFEEHQQPMPITEEPQEKAAGMELDALADAFAEDESPADSTSGTVPETADAVTEIDAPSPADDPEKKVMSLYEKAAAVAAAAGVTATAAEASAPKQSAASASRPDADAKPAPAPTRKWDTTPTPKPDATTAAKPDKPTRDTPISVISASPSRGWNIAAILLAALGLGVGSYAYWAVTGLQDQLQAKHVEGRELLAQTASRDPRAAADAALPGENAAKIEDLTETLDQRLTNMQAQIQELQRELDTRQTMGGSGLSQKIGVLESSLADLERQLSELRKLPLAPVATPRSAAGPAPTVVRKTGPWAVNLASFARKSVADKEVGILQTRGIDAEVKVVSTGGKTWYRLAVTGFDSQAEAKRFARKVRALPDMESAWIGKLH